MVSDDETLKETDPVSEQEEDGEALAQKMQKADSQVIENISLSDGEVSLSELRGKLKRFNL